MAFPWLALGLGALGLFGAMQPKPQAPKPEQALLPQQQQLINALMPHITGQIGKPAPVYGGQLTVGTTPMQQWYADWLKQRQTASPWNPTEQQTQELISKRLSEGYEAISPEIKAAMTGRVREQLQEQADEIRKRQEADFARRGLFQSGLLAGAQAKTDEAQMKEYAKALRDLEIAWDEARRSDIAQAMGLAAQMGGEERQWRDLGLQMGIQLANQLAGQSYQDIANQYNAWLQQQQAAQVPVQQALALIGAMQPAAGNAWQAAMQQYQNAVEGQQGFWGGLGKLVGMWLPGMYPDLFPGFAR